MAGSTSSLCIIRMLVLSLSVVVIINVLWEGSAFIRQASMVRHSGTRYSNRSMEDLILSDASAGEDADTGEEYNMCESLCDGGALNTTVESPLICYSFWWFYYEEEKDDYNIMYNPSPYSTANCLKAMEYSHFKLMEIACSVCSGSTDSISPKKTSKSPPPPPTDDVGSYRLPPAASESWALKSPEQLSPIITRLASPLSPKRGRGVVYTGDGAHMRLILVSVRMLREHNVDIPVEVFVPESALGYCRNIPWGSNNVKCRATPPLHKYVNKLYAILASSFEEVLFMDADNFVLRDPERLFDAPEYKKTGAMFWPDLWGYACTHPTNLDQSRKDNMKHPKSMRHEIRNLCGQSTWPDHGMWRYTGVQWKPEWKVVQEFESGQLIVNQTRHRAALMLTMFLATDTFAQNVLYGDKDCFKFAWMMLNASYTLVEDLPSQIGWMDLKHTEQFDRHVVVQNYNSTAFFIHQRKDGRVPGPLLMLKPKTNFVWKNSSAFQFSYCPTGYDNFKIDSEEFEVVQDPFASHFQRWDEHMNSK